MTLESEYLCLSLIWEQRSAFRRKKKLTNEIYFILIRLIESILQKIKSGVVVEEFSFLR